MLPALAHPERVAAASIRGYLYQTVGIALRWLALPAGELLLCEGDEDAEHYLFDADGALRDVTQVQFKDINDTLSARNEEIRATIFNFLRSFAHHHAADRTVRFVFTTSARRARQQISKSDDDGVVHAVLLGIDVLKTWMSLAAQEDRTAAEGELVAALRALVAGAKPTPPSDGKASKSDCDYRELEAAVAYIDADLSRWPGFLGAVEWQFDQGGIADRLIELEKALAADERTCSLPPGVFARRVVLKVLETSTDSDAQLRTLDRTTLDTLAVTSASELETWASTTRAIQFRAWMAAIDARLEGLEATTTIHTRRLDEHDTQLAELHTAAREKLKRASARHLAYLKTFRGLQLDGATVYIKREVVDVVAAAVLERSLLVVGDPGAGKSGALADVAAVLDQRGHDVVVLTADAAQAMGDELVDVLQTWDGERAGIVIVDALDSIRDDARAAALRKTIGDIERLSGRWRVVATIRTFDLYQGTSTARLFAGKPSATFTDPRFPYVRHIVVGDLTEPEVGQLEAVAKPLFEMITKAPAALAKLLRVPFHLMLTAALLNAGTSAAEIASVRTRVGLLDLYWEHRVANHAPSRGPREALLRDVCDRMIGHRSLQCLKSGLDPDRLYELLSVDVLREPPSNDGRNDDGVIFSHHVLFDYVVARLWWPRDAHGLAERLAADSQLLIVVRPSLEMAVQRWWAQDDARTSFWNGVLVLCSHTGVRGIGKLIGPGIAAAEATSPDDIRPLIDSLAAPDPDRHCAADDAVSHLVGALIPRPRSGRPISGTTAGPWAELAEAAAGTARASPRENARRLLHALTARPEDLTPNQLAAAGRASRILFAAGAASDGAARWLLPDAVAFVSRTQRSDPSATSTLIRAILTTEMLNELGFVLLPRVAREISHLFRDAELVEAIYRAAYGRVEDSREETSFGGVVFSLGSNRRQDYESALFTLREAYPAFLETAPVVATRMVFAVLQAYAEREHDLPVTTDHDGSFVVDGQTISVRADYSAVWDGREHEDELVMADAWENFAVELAADPAHEPMLRSLFAACIGGGRLAITWSRWLHVAERAAPSPASRVVLPLLQSSYVLFADDTTFRAGECLKKVAGDLTASERAEIEHAILGTRLFERHEESAAKTCARLFACLGETTLVTSDARQAWTQLQSNGTPTENRPRFRQPRFGGGRERETDDWLRLRGAPVDDEPHRSVREAARALKEMREDAGTAWTGALDAAEQLASTLTAPAADGVHPLVIDDAWAEVAKTLEHISEIDEAAADRATRDRIGQLALLTAQCPCPRPKLGGERQFHDHPSWDTTHARGDAALVLVWLGQLDQEANVLACIEELAADDVPSVRYRVLTALPRLLATNRDLVWRIAEQSAFAERARAVLGVLVDHVLAALSSNDPERVLRWLGSLLGRIVEGPGAAEVRTRAYQLIGDLWIEDGIPLAATFVREAAARPGSDDAETLVQRLRHSLVVGPVSPPDEESDLQRRRAQSMLLFIVSQGADAMRMLQAAPPSDATVARVREVAGVLQTAGRELFFASGAHDTKDGREQAPTPAVTARFFEETAATMQVLAETGIPPIIHSMIETLDFLLPRAPERAFLMIATAVTSGREGGYAYDSMAIELVVKTVRRFLAEHRAVLQSSERLRDALLDVLDVFVRAGWPQAQELTYGLDEIFR